MKIKILMLLMSLGMLLAAPTFTYAQLTDDDIDFQASDPGDDTYGPVSLDPTLIEGTLSHVNRTIQLEFLYDLGVVTVNIIGENGVQYISEEINTSQETITTIDVKLLPPGKYFILCYTNEGLQRASFEIYK